MTRQFTAVIASLTIIAATSLVGAQDWRVMLDENAQSQLSGEALDIYKKAEIENDRVNYDEAVKLLAEAAELAPENENLQFLVASRARDRAEVYYGAAAYRLPPQNNMDYTSPDWRTAEPFIQMADAALNRLESMTDLSAEERSRVENERAFLERERQNLEVRDAAREETSLPLVVKIKNLREEAMNPEGDELDPLDTRNAFKQVKPTFGEFTEEDLKRNPFALLPGEHIEPFLPPPPQPQQGQQFGDPYGQQNFGDTGVNPFADTPSDTPGPNPFGGGK